MLLAALSVMACTDSTPPLPGHAGSAHYTVTVLPANTSTVYDDNAYFLSSGALVTGVVDQSTSSMSLISRGTAVLDGSFVINFRSSTGTPTGRIEGSFTATTHPCQSKVGSDGLLTGPCTLPQ